MGSYDDCDCVYPHFTPDLLYGIFKFRSSTDNKLYQCFNKNASLSIHGVYRCTQQCPVLTTENHHHKYESPAVPMRRSSGHAVSFFSALDTLVNDCKVYPKYLYISKQHFSDTWAYRFPKDFESLAKSLAFVEGIAIHKGSRSRRYLFDNVSDNDEEWKKLMKILEIAFLENKHLIKSLNIASSGCIKDIAPYLTNSTDCNLKQMQVFYEPSDDELLYQILEHQRVLEKATFYIENGDNASIEPTQTIKAITELLHCPTMKELTFDDCYNIICSPEVVINFLRQFFTSPYPVDLCLSVNCPHIDPSTQQPLLVNTQSETDKSLELDGTYSSNLGSFLPPNLVLKSLKVNMNVVSLLIQLESIKVETFTLIGTRQLIDQDNVNNICSLFRIVNAQWWDLFINIIKDSDSEDDTIDIFVSALSRIADRIKSFTLLSSYRSIDIISIMEPIFTALDSTRPPYLELGIALDDMDAKALYDLWEKNGSVKLKSIKFVDGCKPVDEEEKLFSEMALTCS